MNAATRQKIEGILKSSYDTAGFVGLMQEILPDMRVIAPNNYREEKSNFSSHIEGHYDIGKFQTTDKKNIVILAVALRAASYVENSRSVQRSFAKKLIENAHADAALIAFYTVGNPRWRFSFVRLDYEMKFEHGRLKAAENLTPARRYSYLVGEGEPCHTAISRFAVFITNSEANAEHPTLDDFEDAFSVEKVTNEFFQLYREKFDKLQNLLEKNEDFRTEAKQHNFSSAQFAKKLLGQIVFLYFLQKKGWLGVKAWPNTLSEREYKDAFFNHSKKARELLPKVYKPVGDGIYKLSGSGLESIGDADEELLARCVKGNAWGTGPQNFMRKLFEESEKQEANFFDDYLEPLFYDALNVNRGEQAYCPALHCRIPFLSGGLFEPIDGYNWKDNDFDIPNKIFSNISTEGRNADGILDIFDRYNFTMSEDEPLEREVAIDPEMLGKVFENLLETDDRRSTGSFYTPREIVHYMCQESLINYLTKTLQIEEGAIRDFILYGDFMKAEDTVWQKKHGKDSMYISEQLYKLDRNGKVVVNRLWDMDNALKNMRVADPAVGSGAFPLGMLNEIVRARQNITAYMAIGKRLTDARLMYQVERSPYQLKWETIKNCIFAADIDPSAVDIAQLRLWLALVIDDEINPNAGDLREGHRNPEPLPNLECNILCGNSLLDDFEGNKLINASELVGTTHSNQQQNFQQERFDFVLKKLIVKQDELYRCKDTYNKHRILEDIAALRDEIIMSQLAGCNGEQMRRYVATKKAASKPYVLWQLDFASVFREKGGFDIVIGNPPYIQLQKAVSEDSSTKLGDLYVHCGYEVFARTGDIYCLFYEKAYQLLRDKGVLAFITSNKWMRAGYGEKLRKFFANKTNPLVLLDFAGQKIFESATVDVNILLYEKAENQGKTTACIVNENCGTNLSVYISHNCSKSSSFLSSDSWTILSPIEQSIKQKIEAVGVPLRDWDIKIYRGILTGCNDAFIVSGEKKDELITADPKSAEIIRPILRGKDIKRYKCDFADLWLINAHNGIKEKNVPPINVNDYPAIKEHLDQYHTKLTKRTDKGETPYNLRSCAYMEEFSKQRIAYREISSSMDATLIGENIFINNSNFAV